MVPGCEYHYYGNIETGRVLYPSNAKADRKKYVISPRMEILISLKRDTNIDFRFQDDNLNQKTHLDAGILWGWDIAFYYKKDGIDYLFVWQWWKNWVDMYDERGKLWDYGNSLMEETQKALRQRYTRLHSHFTDDPEHEKEPHFFFDAASLKAELNRCVSDYEQIKSGAIQNA